MKPYSYRRPVQFAECDPAGILHFSNYLRYCEEAEHALLESLELPVWPVAPHPPIVWPRVAVQCRYHAPLRFQDVAEVRVSLGELSAKFIRYDHEVYRHVPPSADTGEEPVKAAELRLTVAAARLSSERMRATRVPDPWRKALEGALPYSPSATVTWTFTAKSRDD